MKPHCPSHKQWYVGVNWKPIIYHMIITIDDNTHSGGVSLQPTKRRIVYNFFLPEWGKLLINDMFQRKKNWLIAFRLPFQWWFGELEKLIIRKKCIIVKLVTYSSGCIFSKGSKRIGILFIPRYSINPEYDCYKWRYSKSDNAIFLYAKITVGWVDRMHHFFSL